MLTKHVHLPAIIVHAWTDPVLYDDENITTRSLHATGVNGTDKQITFGRSFTYFKVKWRHVCRMLSTLPEESRCLK